MQFQRVPTVFLRSFHPNFLHGRVNVMKPESTVAETNIILLVRIEEEIIWSSGTLHTIQGMHKIYGKSRPKPKNPNILHKPDRDWCNYPKIWVTSFYHTLVHLYAIRMTKSKVIEQTATGAVIWVHTVGMSKILGSFRLSVNCAYYWPLPEQTVPTLIYNLMDLNAVRMTKSKDPDQINHFSSLLVVLTIGRSQNPMIPDP